MLKNLSYRMSRWQIDEKLKETKGSWVDVFEDKNTTHSNVVLHFQPSDEKKTFCRIDMTYDKKNAEKAMNEIIADLRLTYDR